MHKDEQASYTHHLNDQGAHCDIAKLLFTLKIPIYSKWCNIEAKGRQYKYQKVLIQLRYQ